MPSIDPSIFTPIDPAFYNPRRETAVEAAWRMFRYDTLQRLLWGTRPDNESIARAAAARLIAEHHGREFSKAAGHFYDIHRSIESSLRSRK